MRPLQIAVLAVCTTAAFLCSCRDVSEPNQPDVGPAAGDIVGLRSENLKEREKAAEAIRKESVERINHLLEFASEKVQRLYPDDPASPYPWHDSKHLATLLLGDLRAIQAVPILLENLEYKNPRSFIQGLLLDQGGWYPAAEALSKIGMPAVGPTIEKLGGYTADSLGHQLCCWVIKEVLGARLGRLRVEIAIEEARDETVRNNLAAVLPYFKTEQEKAAEERAEREKAGQ